MQEYRTVDGVKIVDGLLVWDYDLNLSRVSFADTTGMDSPRGFDGWFTLRTVDGGHRKLMNGERMVTRHPFTRELAGDAATQGTGRPDDRVPQGWCGCTKSGVHVMSDDQICEACGEPYELA